MNLKKNDKIILIVGVVILIIAGAGIALYNTPSDNSDNETDVNDEMPFEFTWSKEMGTANLNNPMVEKDTLFTDMYKLKSPDGTVLTDVKVNIKWEDDNTFGILRTKGQDVLTSKVICDGKSKEEVTTLKGNDNFTYTINSIPESGTKYGMSKSEVNSDLNDEFNNMNTADIEFELSIEPGEPRWRFLLNRDTGNEVELSLEYTYYKLSLNEMDDDDTKSSGSSGDDVEVSSHMLGEFYVNLGYGRGMI
jgi:flagellar basal body-associated protein FliL